MKRNRKMSLKLLSAILSLAIILTIPIPIHAEENINKGITNASIPNESIANNTDDENGTLSDNIVCELQNERTENTKSFLLEDGSSMVAVYDQPVHFEDKNGKWIEYDNTILDSKEDSNDDVLTNKNSNIDIGLAKESENDDLIKVANEKMSICWSYENANHTKAKVTNTNTNKTSEENKTILNNQRSETVYENIFHNVDIEYLVTSNGIKENIILKNSDVQNDFKITYEANGLIAKQTDNHCISLYNNDNTEIARILAPYMVDSKGEISTEVELKLVKQDGDHIEVVLVADESFIKAKDRSFPVIVDPEIQMDLYNNISFTTCRNNHALSYPPYNLSGDSFVLFSLNDLPTLKNGERITRAQLNLAIENGTEAFSNNVDPVIVKAHRVGQISGNSITYDNEVIDYDSLSVEDNNTASFDITQMMRNWYEDEDTHNYIVFEADDTIDSRTISLATPTKTGPVQPTLTYVYKDFTGTESNLSYHSVPAGHNATASVSDYLGNLVIKQPIYEEKGSRNPLSISVTYNSLNYDRAFENGSPSGKGWQFSFNQFISETTGVLAEQGYNYVYRDSDGTDHYLKKDTNKNKWYDEDGMGLVLTPDTNQLVLENGGNEQTYQLPSDGGKLLSEKDDHNNTISYSYDSDGNLQTITDSSGGNAALTYTTLGTGEKRLSKIALPTGQVVFFYYTNNWILNYIYFSGDSASSFEYDTNGRLTVAAKRQYAPIYGQRVSFDYNEAGQVENITEHGNNGTEGNYLNIQYNNDNTTTFTDRKERCATYTFDNDGSLISVLNPNGYISNGSEGLSISGGAESFTKNYISQSTGFSEVGSNSNSYYYKKDSSRNGVTSTGGVCSADDSTSYIGENSLKICNPPSNNNSAFFTSIIHRCNETDFSGNDITFSAYVKTEGISQIYSGGMVGAGLRINCCDSDNNSLASYNSIGIIGTEDWQRLSVSCSVPENTAKVYVYCMLRYASGTAWFDCLQLEEGNSASDFNALQNSDFSGSGSWKNSDNQVVSTQNGTVILNGSPGVYDNDQTSVDDTGATEAPETENETIVENTIETEPYGSITTYDSYGNAVKTEQGFVTREVRNTYQVLPTESDGLAETGSSGESEDTSFGNSHIYQTVNVGRAGVKFNIAGEAQAHSVPLTNENRSFGIALRVNYADETSELHYQEFNAYTDHTQSVSMAVYPNEDNKEIDKVDFAFVYNNNENTMTISNAMLNVALNSYSESNDPDQPQATELTEATEEPEDNRVLIDSEVSTEVVDKTQAYIHTNSEYDSSGRYVISKTDESGEFIDYDYDSRGNLTSIDDARGNVTTYTYNNADQVTAISSENASNTYTYDSLSGNVLTITHNNFTYSFNYDVFDNLIQSKVGTVAVSSNTYDNNNGNLLRTDYANGDYITYTYDNYDNIVKIAGENGTIAQFVYNKKGLISKCVDAPNSLTTYYYYDFEGNKTGEYRQSTDGSLSYYMSVNSNGYQVEKTSVNGQAKTITSGTDSDGNAFVSYDGVTVDTSSDGFGRTEKVTTSQSNSSDSFTTNYEYAEGDGANSTTHRIKTVTQKHGEIQLVKLDYEYNENGDITRIKQDNQVYAVYTYDSKNQLLTSAEKDTGLYKYYIYDNAGNLTGVREYTLNPDNMWYGSYIGSHTYSYGDTNWKDKLTAYDNTTLTYDANGNPLSYRDGMSFTWVNGRILDSVTVGNTTLSMKYDSNGMRTKKGSIKYYYDSSNNLIGMVNGNNTLLFYYDESGSPTSFSHNGTMYFYIKNLQGDICEIVNASGSVIANYTYDAWGKLLSVKDANGDSILNSTNVALLNPLRYRGYVYDDETGLYYLQSRYYDPTIGRFLNADDLNIILHLSSASILLTNAFAYANNNSVNNVDKTGRFALAVDAVVISFFGVCVTVYGAVQIWKNRKAIGNALKSFFKWAGDGISSFWSWISGQNVKSAKNPPSKLARIIASKINKYSRISKADARIRAKVRRKSKTRYWSANLRDGYVDIGTPLSFTTARKYVKSGRSVFTVTRAEAFALAKSAGGNLTPIFHSRHYNLIGYYHHFHMHGHPNKAHVWYLFNK